MRTKIVLFLFVVAFKFASAQYLFEGYIDNDRWQNDVYLSVIDDYRTVELIDDEQVISRISSDSSGYFVFEGDNFENVNKIYKLHVDNCSSADKLSSHFDGHCSDSKNILFIAKSGDTISFPLTFDEQMFCAVNSTNPKTSAFIKIDSLRDQMKFEYAEYRSKANRKLNNEKWFTKLHDYGNNFKEPLAELYIYSFLSDRTSPLHQYYLEDLKINGTYYEGLLDRLKKYYPKSSYADQYEAELTADKMMYASKHTEKTFNWDYIVIPLLIFSVGVNIYFLFNAKKEKRTKIDTLRANLTNQERTILELILKNSTNKEIAELLFVSVSTVKTHVNNIFKKLNVQSREDAKALF